jgi:tetratricopeptide (TPR) repeat protein
MKIKSFCCLALALFASTCLCLPGRADDFPGRGDRFAWSNALPYYNLANKYLEHGRYDEAKTNFEEAIYRYEYDPDFFINYGVALRKLESYAAAEEAFKKALELRKNDWQAWSNLANAYLKQNKLKDTIACFQKAMKVEPPPPAAEKEAMLKDIADINKILAMQAPLPAPPAEKAGGGKTGAGNLAGNPSGSDSGLQSSVRAARHGGAAARKSPAKSRAESGKRIETQGSGAPGAKPGEPAAMPVMDKQELKKSGWDWVK